jgi:hypothetical protein
MAPLHAQQSVHDVGSRIEAPGDAKPLPWKSVEQKMIFHKAGAMWFQFANPKTGGEKLTYTDASAFCKQYGLRLPTREEVQTTRAELEIADAKLMRYERDFWVSYQPEGEKYSQMQLATNFGLNLGYKYMAVDSGMYDKAPLGTLIRCVFDAASPTLPGEPWRSDLATDVPPSMK